MSYSTDFRESYWWSCLSEFGDEVLVTNRKKRRISQKKIAELLSINQSEVSRLERGLTRPKNIAFAQAICAAYGLSFSQKQKYLELLTGIPIIDAKMIVSLLDHQTAFIAQLNRSGAPSLAIQQAENLLEWTNANIPITPQQQSVLLGKISRLHLEESAAWWDVVTTTDELPKHTTPLLNRMQTLRTFNTLNQSSDIYYRINQAFHAYVRGDFQSSALLFEAILSSMGCIDQLWHIEVLRAAIISASKCKEYQTVMAIESTITTYIHKHQLSSLDQGYLLEGIARAYIEFSPEKSLDIFAAAQKHITAAQKEPNFLTIRSIQLTRSYIYALKRSSASYATVLEIAKPALKQAEKGGFNRHAYQIRLILGKTTQTKF